jgi:threo-3-hydroxy-L-aspartate ammonia-lyase
VFFSLVKEIHFLYFVHAQFDEIFMISFSDISSAYTIVQPVVHKTPLLTSRSLNSRCGNDVFLKAENFQRVGAFKIRGAYHKIATLTNEEKRHGVITHSSGNHAQGVALAAGLLHMKAVVVMPHSSPRIKVEATRSYGADIVFCEDSTDDRERVASALQQQHGYILVPPFDDDKIIAGQGTVVMEIAQELRVLD